MKKCRFVLPLDGCKNPRQLKAMLEKAFSVEGSKEAISHIKVNDAGHMYGEGSRAVEFICNWLEENNLSHIKIWVDLKLPDTSGTDKNILEQYTENGIMPDIVTVQACSSLSAVKKVRAEFPDITLALVSVLTDIEEEECIARFGVPPTEKIANDLSYFQDNADNAFDAVVCSPHELAGLKNQFPDVKLFAVSIRDEWMKPGQQRRYSGIRFAVESGAVLAVAGSQLTKGNPDKGISPSESMRMTLEERDKAEVLT